MLLSFHQCETRRWRVRHCSAAPARGAPILSPAPRLFVLQHACMWIMLPTCPTYAETKLERNSPRGRIALMRAIADGRLGITEAFGEETLFLSGLSGLRHGLSPGVQYRRCLKMRAAISNVRACSTGRAHMVRALTLRLLFTRRGCFGRSDGCCGWYQASGVETLVRKLRTDGVCSRALASSSTAHPAGAAALFGFVDWRDVESPVEPDGTVWGMLTVVCRIDLPARQQRHG